jgi:predicted regulator of Ras-like GTPase activity (Roadblock/LC7/MglB family)
MFSLPQLIEEDISRFDGALRELVTRSESSAALICDIGGFLITQSGDLAQFDTTTIGALASASFAATQAIASLVSESNFNSIYQQGENFSMLMQNIDGQCLLVVIFKSSISVGVVKYFAAGTIGQIAAQMKAARERDPEAGIDLSSLNLADPSEIFKRKN